MTTDGKIRSLSLAAHKAFHAGNFDKFYQLTAERYYLVGLTLKDGETMDGRGGEQCPRPQCGQTWPDYSHGMGKFDEPGCPGCHDTIPTIERLIYKAKSRIRGH